MPASTRSRNPENHSSEYISLRDYIDTRITAMEKAVDVATTNLELRLSSLNEIRDALRDRDTTFTTKVEFNAVNDKIYGLIEQLQSDARSLRESRAEMVGKADQEVVNRVLLISVVGIILSIVGILLGFFGV